MAEPLFKLQVVYPDGSLVPLSAGGPLEIDFIQRCAEAICLHGVGVLKTRAQVEKAIVTGITDTLMALKRRTISLVPYDGRH